MNDLGKRISNQRKKHGWTQAELGIKLNVTAQAVSKWENNASEPDIQTLLNMANLFDVSLDEMLNAQPEEPEAKPAAEGTQADAPEVIGFCITCGRMLREGEAAEMKPAILCFDCKAKADEKARQEEENRRAEEARLRAEQVRREQAEKAQKEADRVHKNALIAQRQSKLTGALIWSGVIAAAAVGVFVGLDVKYFTWTPLHLLWYALFAYFSYAFVAQLFFGSDFVYDCVTWGLTRTVRFPMFIFSLDLDGIIWFILVKVICGILSFFAGIFFAVLGIVFGMLCSGFAFPFALVSKKREVNDENNPNASISD